mgnify:CR=1 FL=1
MNLKKIFLVIAGLGILLNSSAQTSKRYTVAKPGTLVEMLTEEEANEITHLVLQGKLNAIDFRHLRDEFKKLQILDISNASISMYAGILPTASRLTPFVSKSMIACLQEKLL